MKDDRVQCHLSRGVPKVELPVFLLLIDERVRLTRCGLHHVSAHVAFDGNRMRK